MSARKHSAPVGSCQVSVTEPSPGTRAVTTEHPPAAALPVPGSRATRSPGPGQGQQQPRARYASSRPARWPAHGGCARGPPSGRLGGVRREGPPIAGCCWCLSSLPWGAGCGPPTPRHRRQPADSTQLLIRGRGSSELRVTLAEPCWTGPRWHARKKCDLVVKSQPRAQRAH